jgi:hypothetical protein
MHDLAILMAQRINEGLKRKSLSKCSRWACACRVMGKPYPGAWTFKHHPWLRAMHDSEAEVNVGQKSAQMGYTETVLNVTFYNIDQKGVDCLYILPAKTPDASDFSASRFDPALELSPHLSNMFSEVKNIGHKRAGTNNLFIRGSRSRSGLKSVPVGLIILDELDEMTQENIPLVKERSSGQVEKALWMISTATIENYGINKEFNASTQNHFFFPCPHCSRHVELTFPKSLVIVGDDPNNQQIHQSHLICPNCQHILEHAAKTDFLAKGIWQPGHTGRDTEGWYINQLYSCTVSPGEIAKLYLESLSDKAAEQEFYNSKLGLPHAVEGARITDADLDACRGSHKNGDVITPNVTTMGVDVGTWLHYHIDEWFLPSNVSGADISVLSRCRTVKFGKVRNFDELDLLMTQWGINFCVIDANPERRKAYEFACRFWGKVRLCFYAQGVTGKQIKLKDDTEPAVDVDRTSWLDLSLGRYHGPRRSISLPLDIDLEYRGHLKALVRVYEKDKEGNPIGRYVKAPAIDDHYAHARNYSEIAMPLAVALGKSRDMPNNIM